ncbi:Hsp20/alpha crystallin family protein [Spirosoma sp. BT702]|uniref:Hsp20/alpha crystallin family protein n=1 Tax=Spirosoma profusum TaxID=2771354 RepID=A0A926XWK2_9BACT|nr:Hsp20/alpha crystallin family protein [Spirosoma profusum]MBD2702154.1 Hsp20/alpha crystallin family protein [Spirosoma profusum]
MYNHGYAGHRFARGHHHGAHFFDRFTGATSFRRPKYNVPINIIDHDTFFEVHVYALGFDKENISVSVSDDVLTISGTRSIDETQKPTFLRQEYPIKSFERVVQLNDKVDVANISAKQENGVLIVTLPKKSSAPGVTIEVM